jgi:hypothetical protein
VVVEAAGALGRLRRRPGAREIRFVLFDGEEPPAGLPEESTDFYSEGLRGSRAYVARHRGRTAAMVLLDYVGNRGLQLPREASSTPGLWARMRTAARRVGAARFFPNETGTAIVDDHTPFLRAGVAAVDLIDWSYPGHELSDGLHKLSRRSLDAVGETVVDLVLGGCDGHDQGEHRHETRGHRKRRGDGLPAAVDQHRRTEGEDSQPHGAEKRAPRPLCERSRRTDGDRTGRAALWCDRPRHPSAGGWCLERRALSGQCEAFAGVGSSHSIQGSRARAECRYVWDGVR